MRTLARTAVVVALVATAGATGSGGALADGSKASPGVLAGWDGVRAPGSDVRYVALPNRTETSLAAVRVPSGRIVRFSTLAGLFGVPLVAFDGTAGGLAADGKTLVLASSGGAGSRFAVVSTRTLRPLRTISLRGSWAFDALSPDGRTLYAIEYRSPGDAFAYRVRAVDLTTGRVRPGAIVDPREPDEQMGGLPLTRASSANGVWAYTLYTNAEHPFVHALDTRRGVAFCIDLPWRGGQALDTVRMRVTRGGRSLVLRQAAVGRLAVVDTRTFAVRAVAAPAA
jgi:hypothetical protein